MVALQPLVAEFTIVGRLEDFVISSKGRVKYLSVSTPEAEYLIDVAKSDNSNLSQYLQPGCHLRVTGMRKHNPHKDQVKYKAYSIELLPELSPTIKATATQRNKRKVEDSVSFPLINVWRSIQILV